MAIEQDGAFVAHMKYPGQSAQQGHSSGRRVARPVALVAQWPAAAEFFRYGHESVSNYELHY